MKLNYSNTLNSIKTVIKLNGKLVKSPRNDEMSVEITAMEAVKLYATMLAKDMGGEGVFNNPVTLDKDAEEMVEIKHIIVKTNAGPKAGIKTSELPADPGRFIENGVEFLLPVETK